MNPPPSAFYFGGDGVDIPHEAIRDHVARILCAPGFAKSPRLKRFLSYTVDRSLAGDADNLKEYSLALEVFDRSPDYNPKVDAVVRVEARRLRTRLEEYYATEGLHEPIRIRFPIGAYVPLISRSEATASPAPRPEAKDLPVVPHRRRWWPLFAALAMAVLAAVLFSFPRQRQPTVEIARLIRDSTTAFNPAVSADGRLLAYSSDQSGNFDIWVRSLDADEPRRLTSDVGTDAAPDFSRDGTEIVFRSERSGGGVYVIPAAGGRERLLAPRGRSPKFSPDGKWIAYWIGESHHFEGKTYIVPSIGGDALPVGAGLADAKWPVWSPDGKALLVYGSRQSATAGGTAPGPMDLFLVPVAGGSAAETGWTASLHRAHIGSVGSVSWNGAELQFSASTAPQTEFSSLSQGVANLWEIRLDARRGRVEGEPRRLTFGSAFEGEPVLLRGGGEIYSSTHYTLTPFGILLDGHGMPRNGLQPSFASAGSYVMPRISRDGSRLVALSDRSGQVDIWARDLNTGEEWAVTATKAPERAPVLSRDGRVVYFGIREGPHYPMYKVDVRGGIPRKLCDDCGALADVSSDGSFLLFNNGKPWSAYSLNLVTGKKTKILERGLPSYSSRFSPDDKWIAFLAATGADEDPRQIFVAPFQPDQPVPAAQWIPVTDGGHRDFDPCWSGDGTILYFLSDRDGNRCLWATRVDGRGKRPIGEPFPLQHLHSGKAQIPLNTGAGVFGVSSGGGRLVFGAAETSSTILRLESVK